MYGEIFDLARNCGWNVMFLKKNYVILDILSLFMVLFRIIFVPLHLW